MIQKTFFLVLAASLPGLGCYIKFLMFRNPGGTLDFFLFFFYKKTFVCVCVYVCMCLSVCLCITCMQVPFEIRRGYQGT